MRLLLWIILPALLPAQDVAFVTKKAGGPVTIHEGEKRARLRLAPCSTFKIPNAAIGLDTGFIPSPDHVLKYDDARHRTQKFWPAEWARDQDLRAAFRVSAIWYFREIATGVGREKMQALLDRFQYGNRDISGWSDPFWLGSSLRVSPVEQVEFMDRLFRNDFGLKPSTVAAVESFMKQDAAAGRTLYYKTGACTDRDAGPEVWLAGFVDSPGGRTYFTMSAGAQNMDDIFSRRIELGKDRLRRAGLWP